MAHARPHAPPLSRRPPPMKREQKITLGEMRDAGVRGVLVYLPTPILEG
jgi:hypothetical protein